MDLSLIKTFLIHLDAAGDDGEKKEKVEDAAENSAEAPAAPAEAKAS